MRKAAWLIAVLSLAAGCSTGGSSTSGTTGGHPLKDGVVLEVNKTRMLFGQDFGDATLLGTAPLDTLEIFSAGKSDLVIGQVEIVSGTDTDGGPLGNPELFQTAGVNAQTLKGGDTGFVQAVFKPTQAGFFGAILRIHSNATPATLDVPLSGNAVTPMVAVINNNGSTDITAPTVRLAVKGTLPDGGADYFTGYSQTELDFANSGTAQLTFQPATFASDAGPDDFEVCTPIPNSNGCQPGPLPTSLTRAYPDGGLAISGSADGGLHNVARLKVGFTPSRPGSYTQHVYVNSTATNTPVVELTVHGTATP
jgi:hypothetical protein